MRLMIFAKLSIRQNAGRVSLCRMIRTWNRVFRSYCVSGMIVRAVVRRINGCVRRIYSVVPRARRMENAPIMKKVVLLTHLMSARMGVVMKDARIVCCVRITLMLRRVIAAARIKRRRVRVFVFQRIKNVVPPVLAFSVGKDYNVVRRQ